MSSSPITSAGLGSAWARHPAIIFFDVAGTLIHVRGSVGEVYADVARQFGARPNPERLEMAFRERFRDAPPLAFPDARPDELPSLEKEWWKTVVRRTFANAAPPDPFDCYFDELFERFRTGRAWKPFADTRQTLDTLTARGVRLGIITNFDARVEDVLSALDLRRYFGTVTISSRSGAAKPNPEIFRHAAREAGVDAAAALHVGDSLREDVAGARAAGMNVVLIDRDGDSGAPAEVPTISSLLELVRIVN